MTIQSSHGDIKHISGTLNSDDLYALPNKRKQPQNRDDGQVYEIGSDEEGNSNGKDDDDCDEEKGKKDSIDGIEDKDRNKDLPFGWEKHEGKCNVHFTSIDKSEEKEEKKNTHCVSSFPQRPYRMPTISYLMIFY